MGEKLRRALDMEDWPAFDRSFRAMESLLIDLATNREQAPATITVLGGDIHFSYATELLLRDGSPTVSRLHQIVSSPMRNLLAARDRRSLRLAASTIGRLTADLLQRWVGRPASRLCWELDDDPVFGNTIGTLEFDGEGARARIECAGRGDDDRYRLDVALDRWLSMAPRSI